MIITVGNTKGGVGKTTLAINIAAARAMSGSDVWLVDGDRQGSAQIAIGIRSESNQHKGIACSQYVDGSVLRTQVLQQKSKYQDIVIDAGGRDSTALRAALIISDVLLIPFTPRNFDVWALADIASLVDEANSVRDGLRVYCILNLADSAGTDNEDAAEAVKDYPQFIYLDAPLKKRKSWANAAGIGISVLEQSPKDVKAQDELKNLLKILF